MKQEILFKVFDTFFDPRFGHKSTKLLNRLTLITEGDSGIITEVRYDGQKVTGLVDGKYVMTIRPSHKFVKDANNARQEFDATQLGQYDRYLEKQGLQDTPPDTLIRLYREHMEINPEARFRNCEAVGDVYNLNGNIRLEKFKRWARKNVFLLSGLAIAIASAITAVILVTRQVLKKGAKMAKETKKVIDDSSEKTPFGPFISWITIMGEKGLEFLSNNLWVIALIITPIVLNKNGY